MRRFAGCNPSEAPGRAHRLIDAEDVVPQRGYERPEPAAARQRGCAKRSVMFGVIVSVHASAIELGLKHTLSSHAW